MITRRSMFGLALVPWAPKPAAPTLVAEFIRLAGQPFPEEFMQPLPLPTRITRLDVQRAFDLIEEMLKSAEYGHWLVVSHEGFHIGESWIMSWQATRTEFEAWQDRCYPRQGRKSRSHHISLATVSRQALLQRSVRAHR